MSQEKSVALYFTEGSSDKVYQVQLVPDPNGWSVNAQNGRRGKALTSQSKGSGLPYEKADAIYEKLVKEKTRKGYTPEESGAVFSSPEHAGRVTGFRPQLLNEISLEEALALGDDWLVQTKHDGERRGVDLIDNKAVFSNRKGLSVGVLQDIETAALRLHEIVGPLGLDAEDMGDHLAIFDVTTHFMMDAQSDFETRGAVLAHLDKTARENGLAGALQFDVPVPMSVFIAHGGADVMRQAGFEGFVVRRASSIYTPGRPSSGGDALKVKFWEEATCRVAAGRDGKRSVGLELMDDAGDWVAVGNVTIPPSAAIPEVGTLIDVKYLYAFPGGSLFEPSFRKPRTDLDESSCALSQLKLKGQGPAEQISADLSPSM